MEKGPIAESAKLNEEIIGDENFLKQKLTDKKKKKQKRR